MKREENYENMKKRTGMRIMRIILMRNNNTGATNDEVNSTSKTTTITKWKKKKWETRSFFEWISEDTIHPNNYNH